MDFTNFKIVQEVGKVEYLLKEGKSVREISEILELKIDQVSWIIRRDGLEIINSGRLQHNQDYFDIIDTEAKAYLLGFIIADGCITEEQGRKRLVVGNSIDDLSVIKLLQSEISPNTEIRYTEGNSLGVNERKPQARFRISCDYLCNILINTHSVKVNKTRDSEFTFNFYCMNESLVNHFVRGFFDGDGSVSFYPKNKTIFFDLSFVFNSLLFANQITNIIESIVDVRTVIYKHVGKTSTYYQVRFDYSRDRYRKVKIIYDFLYKDANYFLERKKEKFINYFEYRVN